MGGQIDTALKKNYKLKRVSVRLVKEASICSQKPITCVEDAVGLVGSCLLEMDREVVCVINMKTNGQPINYTFASIGSLNSSIVEPREILKASILSNAAGMVMLHNHPSGSSKPSKEDDDVTQRINECCKLMGISLLDHIIIGDSINNYYSYLENERILNNNRSRTI